MRLDELTIESAKTLEGTVFSVAIADGGTTSMTLEEALPIEIRQRRRRVPLKREPFSLYFLGDPAIVLAQGTYTLRSESNTFELFIVPIGQYEEGTEYEAVFT
jgi:hypothetical protein